MGAVTRVIRMSAEVLAVVVAAALAFVPPVWEVTRHVATLVHEAGHAVVAVLTGRRLNGIRLHADTSGLTVSTGRARGPGMIATAAAGYPAPSAVGLGVLALVVHDHATWALTVALAVLVAMVVFIRNWFGLLVVVVAGAAVALVTYRADGPVQDLALMTFAWFLLLAGPRTSLDLWGHRRRVTSRTTDADILARLTHVPALIWNALFVVVSIAAVVVAVRITGLLG